tara:strand:- start:39484 stop:40044 length:561 start_codon:yes stop_codon:yes gene_type:complete
VSILKTIREEKGYTQKDLADKTGLSLRTIQRLESSEKVPKGYTLTALAKEFDVEPETLKEKFVKVKDSRVAEIATVKIINLSILSFLGIPFGNVIFPFITWKKNKDSEFVSEVGGRIVNFQLLFSIVLCVILILTPFTIQKYFPKVSVVLIIFLIAYGFNLLIVVRTAIQIKNHNFDFLKLSFRFV